MATEGQDKGEVYGLRIVGVGASTTPAHDTKHVRESDGSPMTGFSTTTASRDVSRASSEERLRLGQKLGYAAGEMASNVSWNMAAGFLLFYYTDVAMLPVAALGTLMLATRILDAVFDPLAGICVDRTRSRFGKARPYLLYVPIPFAILTVLTFSVPDIGATGKVIYAFVTFTLMGLAYSLVYIPYGALLPLITRNPADRVQLGSFRAMGTSLASILVYGLAMPVVAFVGGADRQAGFTIAALIFGTITAVLFFITFATSREQFVPSAVHDARPSISQAVKQAWANLLWRQAFLIGLLLTVRLGIMISSAAYFAKVILTQTEVISVMLPSLSVAIFAGGLLASFVLRKVELRLANSLGGLLTVLCYLALPHVEGNIPVFLGIFALSNVPIGLHATSLFVMSAKSVDDHERQFGNRAEGVLVAGSSFGQKVGMAIGTSLVAFGLAQAGYDPEQVTSSARMMIESCFYGGPAVLTIAIIAGFWFNRQSGELAK